jgi:hypothetical protein
MYDRDYVKKLEREIELNGSNRFEGWSLKSDKVKAPESKNPDQKVPGNPSHND